MHENDRKNQFFPKKQSKNFGYYAMPARTFFFYDTLLKLSTSFSEKLSFKQKIHSYKRCVGCVSFSNNLAFR